MSWPVQAFRLSTELIEATTEEEALSTFKDLHSLGLAKPPYQDFDVILPARSVVRLYTKNNPNADLVPEDDDAEIIFQVRGEEIATRFKLIGGTRSIDLVEKLYELEALHGVNPPPNHRAGAKQAGIGIVKLLIVLLATKNIVKEVKEDKLVKLGIGKHKERYRYTTTLKIGRITEVTEGEGTGLARRPHLRRGHIRRQHYGPKNELIKQIWIEPVFVNADEKWIGERTAYNVSL